MRLQYFAGEHIDNFGVFKYFEQAYTALHLSLDYVLVGRQLMARLTLELTERTTLRPPLVWLRACM